MTTSVWSGGAKWGPSSNTMVWAPSGATPSGKPVPGVAIGGSSINNQIQSASWSLGPSDPFADLTPAAATFTFIGQLTAEPDDDMVVSTGWGPMWGGRVVTVSETLGVDGIYRTTVTATDKVGQMGGAALRKNNGKTGTLVEIVRYLSRVAGVRVTVTDSSSGTYGLPSLQRIAYFGTTFTGSMLEYLNLAARSSNAMVALQPDGSLRVMTREALHSPDVSNGTFDTNTSGWAATGVGASITRVTASPYEGAGNARIVSGTSLYGGADTAITGTFKAGHTYRLDYYARTISGSANIIGGLGDQAAGDFNNVQKTLTGSWAQYLTDWTPTADRTAASVIFRNTQAVSNTFEVDRVLIYEVVNAAAVGSPSSWTKTLAWGNDVNRWTFSNPDGTDLPDTSIAADILAHGERSFSVDDFLDVDTGSGVALNFTDWWAYTPAARWVVTDGQFVVSDLDQEELLTLAPLDWVTVEGEDWQVMSMQWSIDGPGQPMRLTITADDFLARL